MTVALDNQDPETLRPEDAQQAAEHARRSAKTKLVAVIPTMFAPPPPPQPTLIESEGSSLLRHSPRTLPFTLLGALLMTVLLLVLYAWLG